MDLNWYYIVPSHYPIAYKIMICGCIAVAIACIIGQLIFKNNKIWNKITGSVWLLLWIYTAVVFTILGRQKSSEPQMELRLFWCVKEAWINHDASDWYLIIGNILLFVPLGVIASVFLKKLCVWWKITLVGFGTSLIIETTQLILHCGLFELDDLFHNTLGCYLGYCLYMIVSGLVTKERWKDRKKECVISIISWVVIVSFFGIAIFMGQPVFEYFIQ